jgi:hypothetical protein
MQAVRPRRAAVPGACGRARRRVGFRPDVCDGARGIIVETPHFVETFQRHAQETET